jgi:hypothetical protein
MINVFAMQERALIVMWKHNRYWYENITQQNGNQKEAKNCIQRRFETIDEREDIFYQNKIEKDRPSFGKVREALILCFMIKLSLLWVFLTTENYVILFPINLIIF